MIVTYPGLFKRDRVRIFISTIAVSLHRKAFVEFQLFFLKPKEF